MRKWEGIGLVCLVFLGKLLYLSILGVLYENDSFGYLTLHAGLYHPPGYGVFNFLVLSLWDHPVAIVLVQSLIFSSLSASLITKIWKNRRHRWIACGLLAFDPCTGHLAVSIMVETLFTSLLFIVLILLLQKELKFQRIFLTGLVLGMAYLFRYTSAVMLVAICLSLILPIMKNFVLSKSGKKSTEKIMGNRRPEKEQRFEYLKKLGLVVALIAGFQVAVFPLRLYYKQKFDTWKINAFSGMSLWNTTAYLYPGSKVQSQPKTDFERYLDQFPLDQFSMAHTWQTAHVYTPPAPMQSYIREKGLKTGEIMELSSSLIGTAIRLIGQQPIRHLRDFIFPSVWRPFHLKESGTNAEADAFFLDRFGYKKRTPVQYFPFFAWFYTLVLGFSGGWYFFRREKRSSFFLLFVLSLFILLYLAAVTVATVWYLRFFYFLAPFILLIFFFAIFPPSKSTT